MDKTIEIKIRNKIAVQSNDTVYVCGNDDFVIVFDFDDEWAEFETKQARLIYNGVCSDIEFSGNQCAIPVLSDIHNFYVGVYAGSLHATTPAYVGAKKSILCGTYPSVELPESVSNDLVKAIIEGTVTEIDDDTITTVKPYAFYMGQSTAGEAIGTLEKVSLPSATTIGDYAFSNCTALTEVNLPAVTTMGSQSFAGCSALIKVELPLLNIIESYGFSGCSALVEVTFPAATRVKTSAFYFCTALTTLDLPVCTMIYDNAFAACSALSTLILRSGTMCSLVDKTAISSTAIASKTGYIYVPSALLADYQADSVWSTYAARFRALEDYTVDGTTTGELDETKIAS